jgi:hypothetical protein
MDLAMLDCHVIITINFQEEINLLIMKKIVTQFRLELVLFLVYLVLFTFGCMIFT